MADTGSLYPITCKPGIQRDGTRYIKINYIDGIWCRFMRGNPRKMGGYIQIIGNLPNIVRKIILTTQVPYYQVYLGDFQTLKYQTIDQDGIAVGGLIDRTPAGFLVSNDNIWQFDILYSTVSNANLLIAHAGQNLSFIDNTVETPVYSGSLSLNTPLTPTGFNVSGGIAVLNPFLFMFGNDGQIIISNANDPTTSLLTARISSQKIVFGLPTRGGNSSPAGLLWTLNSLIRVTQAGVNNVTSFRFDTVQGETSILSTSSIIEYDKFFYWAGVDRFFYYNGVVNELPNDMNLLYFFQHLNFAQRQKVWATKVPQFGEIWWHYPSDGSTECNKTVIFNVRENTWYDTPIGRAAGYYDQVFAFPIWSDNVANAGTYSLWLHEPTNVYDQIVNNVYTAIPFAYETSDIAFVAQGPMNTGWMGRDKTVDLYSIEPDFWLQTGNLDVIINGSAYAQSTTETSVYLNALTPITERFDLREQRRYMTIRFESNAVGSFSEMGQLLLKLRFGDSRP